MRDLNHQSLGRTSPTDHDLLETFQIFKDIVLPHGLTLLEEIQFLRDAHKEAEKLEEQVTDLENELSDCENENEKLKQTITEWESIDTE